MCTIFVLHYIVSWDRTPPVDIYRAPISDYGSNMKFGGDGGTALWKKANADELKEQMKQSKEAGTELDDCSLDEYGSNKTWMVQASLTLPVMAGVSNIFVSTLWSRDLISWL